jgi:hypothetical protein
MTVVRLVGLAFITAAAPLAMIVSVSSAHAQSPAPGDPCAVLHATAQDASGQTMWCNPMMTGTHGLVWQYGGPA